jgi:hypothetical protein
VLRRSRNVLLHTSPILTIIGENFVHMKPLTNISGLLVVTAPQREGDGCQNHQPNNTKYTPMDDHLSTFHSCFNRVGAIEWVPSLG